MDPARPFPTFQKVFPMRTVSRIAGIFLATAFAAAAVAAPPVIDIPAEVKPTGQYAQFSPKTDAVSVSYVGRSGVDAVPSTILKDPRVFLLDTRGLKDGKYDFTAIAASKEGDQTRFDFAVVVGKGGPVTPDTKPKPPAPPKPKPPAPKPPAPTPVEPVTSFHVVMVYESAKTYDAKTTGVLYSQQISAYLDSATTPDAGTKGWRRRDKDLSADNDTTTQKELWSAIKATLKPDPQQKYPCWAIEVNHKIEIIDQPATVAAGLATAKKFKGEK